MKSFLILILSLIAIESGAQKLIDKAVVVLNSDPILLSDLQDLISRSKKDGGIDEMLLLGDSPSKLRSDRATQIEFLVREKLIESEIKKLGLGISDDRVNSEVNQMASRNRVSRDQLESMIKTQGYTVDEYKRLLKARLERQAFFESEIVGKLRITDEDAYSEYRNTSPDYVENVSSFKIAQIFFTPKTGGAEAAQKRAQDIRKRLTAGESFETLADRYNEDTGAEPGGLLGEFKTGEFNKELESAIGKLSAGDYTPIIRTAQGFHILKILEKTAAKDPNFLRQKEQIKSRLVEKNFQRQLKNWIESKKQDSIIQTF